MFSKLFALHNFEQPLAKIKSSDPCYISPCRGTVLQKPKQTTYVAHAWKSTRLSQSVEFGPDGHGWKLGTDHSLAFAWFEGEQIPGIFKKRRTQQLMQVMIKLAMMSLSDEKIEINFDRMTSSNHTQTHSMKKKFFFN